MTDILRDILNAAAIAFYVYAFIVFRKWHKTAKEVDRMMAELQAERDAIHEAEEDL